MSSEPHDGRVAHPFAVRCSPDLEQSLAHTVDWHLGYGVIGDAEGATYPIDRFVKIETTRLVAQGWPYARGADLDLLADFMGMAAITDEPFDGPLGRDPIQTAHVISQAAEIFHTEDRADLPPYLAALADIWDRSRQGMSRSWCERAAYNYDQWLYAHVHEARGRVRGTPEQFEDYLVIRRGSGGMGIVFDFMERTGGFEVPPAAFHSPELRRMRDLTEDISLLTNDLISAPKEEMVGDIDNLVLVRKHELGCTRDEAMRLVAEDTEQMIDRFCALESGLPALCEQIGLGAAATDAVHRYGAAMRLWLGGSIDWYYTSFRYSLEYARTQSRTANGHRAWQLAPSR
ncbi:hypothetical protein D5S18_27415 [Nocardia panacis]|uniref:Terpene synthase n=1 Tax=Nocardia panacis TaxID=2340916 RepID=A0A3A4JW89_9NOCA|nr:hypothetical protein [Nocardia panacis]RJO70912.1 hypothetical protein D5S18_27415 [Nocardia panacis]